MKHAYRRIAVISPAERRQTRPQMLCRSPIGDMLAPNDSNQISIREAAMTDEPILLEIFTDYV